MNTNNQKPAESQENVKKTVYMNFTRYYLSKDGQKIFLVLQDGLVVPVHVNFIKARMGIPYEPAKKKTNTQAA